MKARAILQIDAFQSADERFAKVVQPLDAALQESGIGKIDSISDRYFSSEHFLTGKVTYTDAIWVEIFDVNSALPKIEDALRTLGISARIDYCYEDGRMEWSVVCPVA